MPDTPRVDKSRRKELLQQYAERPLQNGVFVLRNTMTGEAWVGVSKNIDVQKNSLWAQLSGPVHSSREAHASWKKHGADAFSYEILERFTESDPHVIERLRIERAQHWRDQLKAGTVKA